MEEWGGGEVEPVWGAAWAWGACEAVKVPVQEV